MDTRGVTELGRLFMGPRDWNQDVVYRVHHDLPVFNRLMDPMKLSSEQRLFVASLQGKAGRIQLSEEPVACMY